MNSVVLVPLESLDWLSTALQFITHRRVQAGAPVVVAVINSVDL